MSTTSGVAVTDENVYEKQILPTEGIRLELVYNHLRFSLVLGLDPAMNGIRNRSFGWFWIRSCGVME
jgi:hypothetical protein